jgi:phenylacetate-CoA ligase
VTPSGRILHALGIIYVLREVATLKEFQVIQETVDRVRVIVVPEPGFSDQDREGIVRRVHTLMGPDVEVDVQLTESIQRAASGKFRYVISHVADAHLEAVLAGEPGAAAGRAE